MTPDEAWKILQSADLLCDEAAVRAAIARLAAEITASLKGRYPLVLAVMGGSFFFSPVSFCPGCVFRSNSTMSMRRATAHHLGRRDRVEGGAAGERERPLRARAR